MPTQNLMAATSSLPQVLVSQYVANTETTQYTGPANSAVKIATATLSNPTGANATIAVSLVKASGTAGVANRILPTFTLAAGDSLTLSELSGHFLGPGDFISAIAGTASAVVLVVSGVVFS